MSPLTLPTFLQSTIALMKVRDSAGLDQALVSLLSTCLQSLFELTPHAVRIVRLREIITHLNHQNTPTASPLNTLGIHSSVWQTVKKLLTQNEHTPLITSATHEEIASQALSDWHIFRIPQSMTHKQAAVLLKCDGLTQQSIAVVAQCMSLFHHYADLMRENERDALTGLLNRKTFDKSASQVLLKNFSDTQQTKHHFLAIFDIDFFKKINDNYGHLIGDEVLLLLSQLMTNTFREDDLLFRFGGEEFVAVLSCTHASDILIALNRFRTALANFRFPQVGHVTVSIGCAQLTLDTLPARVIESADKALYYAKEHGRDQICIYEDLLAQGALSEAVIHGDVELF